MSRIEVVVGGAFGSEGKGAVAGWLAARGKPDTVTFAVRVAGPNAGHTVIGDRGCDTSDTVAPNLCEPLLGDGRVVTQTNHDVPAWRGRHAWRLRSVPVAAVTNQTARLVIAAGSEIDPDVLVNEVACLDRAGYAVSNRITVDSGVTVISSEHKFEEKHGRGSWLRDNGAVGVTDHDGIAAKIGSTGKGIGAARADRLWRRAGVCLEQDQYTSTELEHAGIRVTDTSRLLQDSIQQPETQLLIEGTQGYGLGLHARDGEGDLFYPYGTSSDCRAIDFLAMAGVSPWQTGPQRENNGGVMIGYQAAPALSVWVCLRPYPIRVGGNSGPLRGETSWADLGLAEERTTVTNKVRRVGEWDGALARRAIRANGGPGSTVKVALMMFDQVYPACAGQTDPTDFADETVIRSMVGEYEKEIGCPIAVLGTGPDTIMDLRRSITKET